MALLFSASILVMVNKGVTGALEQRSMDLEDYWCSLTGSFLTLEPCTDVPILRAAG